MSVRRGPPPPRPAATCSGPAPSLPPRNRVLGPPVRLEVPLAPALRGLPAAGPAPFTFIAPDRPCRSRRETAMTVTRGGGPGQAEVAPGLTRQLRAYHRLTARPLGRRHQSQARTGAGGAGQRPPGCARRGHAPVELPITDGAIRADAAGGRTHAWPPKRVLPCPCLRRAGAASARVSFPGAPASDRTLEVPGPDPESSVFDGLEALRHVRSAASACPPCDVGSHPILRWAWPPMVSTVPCSSCRRPRARFGAMRAPVPELYADQECKLHFTRMFMACGAKTSPEVGHDCGAGVVSHWPPSSAIDHDSLPCPVQHPLEGEPAHTSDPTWTNWTFIQVAR